MDTAIEFRAIRRFSEEGAIGHTSTFRTRLVSGNVGQIAFGDVSGPIASAGIVLWIEDESTSAFQNDGGSTETLDELLAIRRMSIVAIWLRCAESCVSTRR